jgi:protein-tyrosine phosphatase
MDKIVDKLYLGDIRAAANLFLLKSHGITHVLQVLAGLNPCFPSELSYKVIPVMDVPWENLGKHFKNSNRFIKEAISRGGGVFIHCYAGISRSVTIAIAYLMQEMGYNMF